MGEVVYYMLSYPLFWRERDPEKSARIEDVVALSVFSYSEWCLWEIEWRKSSLTHDLATDESIFAIGTKRDNCNRNFRFFFYKRYEML